MIPSKTFFRMLPATAVAACLGATALFPASASATAYSQDQRAVAQVLADRIVAAIENIMAGPPRSDKQIQAATQTAIQQIFELSAEECPVTQEALIIAERTLNAKMLPQPIRIGFRAVPRTVDRACGPMVRETSAPNFGVDVGGGAGGGGSYTPLR